MDPTAQEPVYPTIYYKAFKAAVERRKIFLGLLAANVCLMALPPLIDACTPEPQSHEMLKLSMQQLQMLSTFKAGVFNTCIFAAVLTTVLVMAQSPKDYLDCRGLAEKSKALAWFYIMKVRPYSGPNEDARELLINELERLVNKNKNIAGSLASANATRTELSDLEKVRNLTLQERIALYATNRIKKQIDEFSTSAARSLRHFRIISICIIALQLATLVSCWQDPHINKWALACIAVTIGLLGWRDSQKLKEQSNTFGTAAELLEPLYARTSLIEKEVDFAQLVERTESVLATEHRLWLLNSGNEVSDDEGGVEQRSVVKRYIQKPVEVSATRVMETGEVNSLEGTEKCAPGDWIITGVKGERWPISNETFKSKYKAIDEKKGLYRKRPVSVEAIQMHCSFTVQARWGLLTGQPGDWLVFANESDSYVCAQNVFEETYEEAFIL
jgi:hypothetical protein